MGHKVHPTIHRTQVIYTWDSKWFGGKKNYQEFIQQDLEIRAYIKKTFKDAQVDAISIERGSKLLTVTVLAAKPGVIIGRGGAGLDTARKHIECVVLKMKTKVKINVLELHNPALSAQVVGQSMAAEIERRMPFRRVMKQTIERVMKAGAKGVKVSMSGRLNGAEIARREKLFAGTIPLITLRSDVDYANVEAQTTYGKIGIKVWICRGEVFGRRDKFESSKTESAKSETKSTEDKRAPRRTPRTSTPRATK
jgi:small subunit ribosomal protein S3